MYREKIEELKQWKDSKNRKPLIFSGARQVGKTWLLKEFGRTEFDDTVYVNFEDDSLARSIFDEDFDTKRIIASLQALKNVNIDPEHTLIILDEAQEAPRVLTAMKYFCENAPEYYICVAGSLLGLAVHEGISYPVGKVEEITLHPLDFCEFLDAIGDQRLAQLVRQADHEALAVFHDRLVSRLKTYFYVGGMPSVVKQFVETNSWLDTRAEQKRLLRAYANDFGKHSGSSAIKIAETWHSIPTQLSRENRKFLFGLIKEGARAREYESAINWLERAGLIHLVYRADAPKMPLIAYRDFSAFKLYHLDIGLLCAMADLDERILLEQDNIFSEYKGALTEQFVAQELLTVENLPLYYWTSDEGHSEIDFLIQRQNRIIPLEVKSGINLRAKSLKSYIDKFSPQLALRSSLANYNESETASGTLLDIPLYLLSNYIREKL